MKHSSGFTLVEALVASGIVMVSVTSILALLTLSLRQASFVQDQLVAANLAQEGLEIVHAIRHDNWLNGRAFNAGLANGDWRVDYLQASLLPWADQPLSFDSNSGFYQYASGAATNFKRKISITNNPGGRPDEILVQSVVEWTSRGIPFSIVAEDHLFNWYPF